MSLIPLLVVVAILLFMAEVLLPGGIAGLGAVLLLILATLLVGFTHGLGSALLFGLGALLLVVVFLCLEIYILRRSPINRMVALSKRNTTSSSVHYAESLVGKQGITLTALRPGGKVRIDNQLFEAACTTADIAPEQPVVVTRIDTFQLIVEPLEASP
jgi:membrane-bound serine protease (ClpP class)